MTMTIEFGPQLCGSLAEAASREWLLTDGLGGYAMGTVAGLRTRRYHGLLVTALARPGGRHLGLASLDPVVVVGDVRHRLAAHEWADGAIAPRGHEHLVRFSVGEGVVTWRWAIGGVVLEAEMAMANGRCALGACYRLIAAGTSSEPVRLELEALGTWRDVHGERHAGGAPMFAVTDDGFTFDGAYRVRGPGFRAGGEWYRGVRHREEAARGLADTEDLWFAGTFSADLRPGDSVEIEAWSGDLDERPPAASVLVRDARARAALLVERARAADTADAMLALAADQFVVSGREAPTVVAGYPWFGDWSRDTMTSYEGLFLETGRDDEGAALLRAAAASLSEGMLANTADAGGTEYNTVDGSLWFLHATGRHVERTGDMDLGVELLDSIMSIVRHHVAGTRFGIRVDDDGLLTQGADGWALTWMDARVDGEPVTARRGKPVEVNALWRRGLHVAAAIAGKAGHDTSQLELLAGRADAAFLRRFVRVDGEGLHDVVDGPSGDDASCRPNQVVAAALGGLPAAVVDSVLRAVAPLVTPFGLRSLAPADPAYAGRHRGGPSERDRAYHQGTVWPWLIGPYVDALDTRRASPVVLDALVAHLGDHGLGSVSETMDGNAPHGATGCPFQAWSVAEVLRGRRSLEARR